VPTLWFSVAQAAGGKCKCDAWYLCSMDHVLRCWFPTNQLPCKPAHGSAVASQKRHSECLARNVLQHSMLLELPVDYSFASRGWHNCSSSIQLLSRLLLLQRHVVSISVGAVRAVPAPGQTVLGSCTPLGTHHRCLTMWFNWAFMPVDTRTVRRGDCRRWWCLIAAAWLHHCPTWPHGLDNVM
jgi:hypothetical protein